MNSTRKIVGILGILALCSFGGYKAMADGYMGASTNFIDTDIANFTGVSLVGGYAFNDFVAFEGRTLINSSNEVVDGVSLEIEELYGAYAIFTLPLTDDLGVYGMYGHTRASAKAEYMGYSETASDSGTSFGVGVKYDIVEAWTVRAEWSEVIDGVDIFAATLTLNF